MARWAVLAICVGWWGAAVAQPVLLVDEPFEDDAWAARGWYDEPRLEVTDQEHQPTGRRACVWQWEHAGDVTPKGRGGRIRFAPTDDVVLEFAVKHSPEWQWTGVPWHPHEFNLLTTADDPFVGPAYTHLTGYVEAVNGVPRLAIQDGRNVDESSVGQDLTGRTEARAVAGCNGDGDGHGNGDCYLSGGVHVNGKYWEAPQAALTREPGPRCQSDWHHVRARLRLNRVVNGVGVRDGWAQLWLDSQLVIDQRDVVFRTGAHPDMRFNQLLMGPYYGPGVPHPQSIWVDDLKLWDARGLGADSAVLEGTDSTWGRAKQPRP